MRTSFTQRAWWQRARWRWATVPVAFAVVAGALLLPAAPAAALDIEVDSTGFAQLIVPDVVDASELWVEVEAPALTAENIVLRVGEAAVALRSTALGAGAILAYDGKSVELAVGVAVAASPDVAITVLGADGAVLFSDHARIFLAPAPGGVTPIPDGSDIPGSGQIGAQPGAGPGGDAGKTSATSPGGVLSATGSELVAYLVVAMLATVLGATVLGAARKKAQR